MKPFQRENEDDRPVRWYEFLDAAWPPNNRDRNLEWAIYSVMVMLIVTLMLAAWLVISLVSALLK